MRIAIVAPSSVPFVLGGAERLWNGLTREINERTSHDCELIKLPTPEHNLPELVDSYERWSHLQLDHFDLVISTKYPAWMVRHPNHTVYLQHTLRGLYDTYPAALGSAVPDEPALRPLLRLLEFPPASRDVREVFGAYRAAFAALGAEHPAFSFPGPLARALVHALDSNALDASRMRRHFAISATVAARRGYFPAGVRVGVVRHPSDLALSAPTAYDYFFTASRLDGAKRLHLLVEAMRHVPDRIRLKIAGTGPEAERLRVLAHGDDRIELLGYVNTTQLLEHYGAALAVPFVPFDEDLGLITLEAMCSAKPVVTTTDAGGPTELVVDGVNGFVTAPNPPAIGSALARLARDASLARRLGGAAERTGATVTWDSVIAALVPDGGPSRRGSSRPSRSGRPRVVVTSTFPVHPRRGGGQLRCFHLYGALTDRFDVEIMSLTSPDDPGGHFDLAPGLTETVVPKSPAHQAREDTHAAAVGVPVTDIVAGSLIGDSPEYLEALADACEGALAVILAHPFLLPAVEAVAPEVPVVYDAHNAEFQLKASILPETPDGHRLLGLVRETEQRALECARVVAVCSTQDEDAFVQAFSLDRAKSVVVPNGVDLDGVPFTPPPTRTENRRRWLEAFARFPGAVDTTDVALFTGSWHPPNIDAAEHIFAYATELPETLFLLAGSHGDYFEPWFRTPRNVIRLGTVSDEVKSLLLSMASVALNPMTRGSGTNLKIVEYMAAGVPVISTELGARGLPVENDVHLLLSPPDTFPAAIADVLAAPDSAAARARRARTIIEEQYDWIALGRRFGEAITAAL